MWEGRKLYHKSAFNLSLKSTLSSFSFLFFLSFFFFSFFFSSLTFIPNISSPLSILETLSEECFHCYTFPPIFFPLSQLSFFLSFSLPLFLSFFLSFFLIPLLSSPGFYLNMFYNISPSNILLPLSPSLLSIFLFPHSFTFQQPSISFLLKLSSYLSTEGERKRRERKIER